MNECRFIHNHGGQLYMVKTTGHVLYVAFIDQNELKPSLVITEYCEVLSEILMQSIKIFPSMGICRMSQITIIYTLIKVSSY